MNDFLELAGKRYSCKCFSGKKLEEEKLAKILEAARIAPTAKDAQAAKIYVLESEEALEKAREITPCTYGAGTVLLFVYDDTAVYKYEDRNSGDQDCAILASHVMLEAADLGAATCWVNNFSPSGIKKALDLPENEYPVLMMPLGYADEQKGGPLAKHSLRKPLEEVVTRR